MIKVRKGILTGNVSELCQFLPVTACKGYGGMYVALVYVSSVRYAYAVCVSGPIGPSGLDTISSQATQAHGRTIQAKGRTLAVEI